MHFRKNDLSIKDILNILPHRYPFLLIDQVLDFKKYKFLKAIKNCTINEPFFQGHFLKEPIYPGVLIIESIAQAAAILIYKSTDFLNINKSYYFVGIDEARFKENVIPGDKMLIEVSILEINKNILKFKSIVTVKNKIVCRSKIIFFKKQLLN